MQVAREIDELARGHGATEELRGDLGQLVRLVEDDRVRAGQQLGDSVVAQGKVGAEQVMVDDDHVGGLRRLARPKDEAVAEVVAILPEAALSGGRRQRPGGRVFGNARRLAAVAGGGDRREALDPAQHRDVLASLETAFGEVSAQVMAADVVRPPLEQRDAGARAERLPHARKVAPEQLILQRLRSGADQHARAAEQRGNEIREGLADAGAGFHDQRLAGVDRLGHRARHLALRRARRVPGSGPGDRSIGVERRVDRFGQTRRGAGKGHQAGSSGTSCIWSNAIASLI